MPLCQTCGGHVCYVFSWIKVREKPAWALLLNTEQMFWSFDACVDASSDNSKVNCMCTRIHLVGQHLKYLVLHNWTWQKSFRKASLTSISINTFDFWCGCLRKPHPQKSHKWHVASLNHKNQHRSLEKSKWTSETQYTFSDRTLKRRNVPSERTKRFAAQFLFIYEILVQEAYQIFTTASDLVQERHQWKYLRGQLPRKTRQSRSLCHLRMFARSSDLGEEFGPHLWAQVLFARQIWNRKDLWRFVESFVCSPKIVQTHCWSLGLKIEIYNWIQTDEETNHRNAKILKVQICWKKFQEPNSKASSRVLCSTPPSWTIISKVLSISCLVALPSRKWNIFLLDFWMKGYSVYTCALDMKFQTLKVELTCTKHICVVEIRVVWVQFIKRSGRFLAVHPAYLANCQKDRTKATLYQTNLRKSSWNHRTQHKKWLWSALRESWPSLPFFISRSNTQLWLRSLARGRNSFSGDERIFW